ncbi:hypothetical protein PHYPO_G00184560 [Pangasianodon hypophthalmus]|uniref:Uncharacterized protein n=1 Tax=Pangasianodon hypophthalmus TaxID=310915 RepID=A0A5N5PR76_PANHP|nr:hypothetical protein PHYPO_G00184560 [Pangasianodon hypophthalmus]
MQRLKLNTLYRRIRTTPSSHTRSFSLLSLQSHAELLVSSACVSLHHQQGAPHEHPQHDGHLKHWKSFPCENMLYIISQSSTVCGEQDTDMTKFSLLHVTLIWSWNRSRFNTTMFKPSYRSVTTSVSATLLSLH